jgi:hypothetical protein
VEVHVRTKSLTAAVLVLGTAVLCGCGGTAVDGRPGPLAAGGIRTDARLNDLAFMAGDWAMNDKDHRSEELWSSPSGSCIMGAFRIVNPDGSCALYELLSVSAEADGVYMRLHHFDDKLMVWKTEEAGPIVLRLESTVRERARLGPTDRTTAPPPGSLGEAVFRKVSGSQSLDSITYRGQGDTLWSEVAFTPASGRETLRFEMKRVR